MAASDNFFQKAEQALKKKNFDYAIAMYTQGLAIDPDRLEERRRLRAAQVQSVQNNGGDTTGGKMFKIKNAKTLTLIARLGKQKKYEEQIVELEKILSIAPQYPPALMSQADAFAATNRPDSAVQSYQWVVSIDPNHTEGWKALARLYEEQKDLEKAVECWEKVKSIAPEDAEAGKAIRDLSAAVMMQRTEDRKAKSKEDSFRAMLKDEDESEKLQKKAQMIRTSDDAAAAIQFKKEEIQGDDQNPRLWRELGALYAKVKKFDEAEAAYRKAKEVDPGDIYAEEKIAELQEARIQTKVEDAKVRLQSNPEDAGVKAELATAEKEMNDFMLVELDRRVTAHPTDFALKSKFGKLLMDNEQWDKAIEQYQKAGKDPKYATDSQANIGRCFAQKGIYSVAKKQLEAALGAVTDQDSDLWKSIAYDLSGVLVKNKEVEEALKLLEDIMTVDISYRDVSQLADQLRS